MNEIAALSSTTMSSAAAKMLKSRPISKVLETMPKGMDKAALLQLAEDAVAYYPEDLLNVSYEDFWDDEYDNIKIFKQISDFASKEIQSDVDFLYRLFFVQIKHFDTIEYRWSRGTLDLVNDLAKKGLLVYPEHRDFIIHVNTLPRKKKLDGELVDDPWMQFRYPRGIIYSPKLVKGNFEDDKEFLLSFTNHFSGVLDIASDRLLQDKQFVLSCVSNYGSNLYHLRSELSNDCDVVWAALFGPKAYEQKARMIGREFAFGKGIGNINAMAYAGDRIKKDKEFLLNVLMELERRYFLDRFTDRRAGVDGGSPPYEELKAMYFGHPKILFREEQGNYNEYDTSTDDRHVNEHLIQHWWKYSYKGKYSQVHYRNFVRKRLTKKLADLNGVSRKKQRTKLRF